MNGLLLPANTCRQSHVKPEAGIYQKFPFPLHLARVAMFIRVVTGICIVFFIAGTAYPAENGKKNQSKNESRPRQQLHIPSPTQAPAPAKAAPAVISISTDGVISELKNSNHKTTPTQTPATAAKATVAEVSPVTEEYDPVIMAIRQGMEDPGGKQNPATNQSELFSKNEGESIVRQIGNVFICLAVVISIVLGSAWTAKKYLLRKTIFGGGHISYLSSFPLSQKSKLHLIKVGDEVFLIGEGNNQLSLISKIDWNGTPAPENKQISDIEEREQTETTGDGSFKSKLAQWAINRWIIRQYRKK